MLSAAHTTGLLNGQSVTNGHDSHLRWNAMGPASQTSTLTTFACDQGSRLSIVSNNDFNATNICFANSPPVRQAALRHNGANRMITSSQFDCLNRPTQMTSPSQGAARLPKELLPVPDPSPTSATGAGF